jgi:hypothetical protein
VFFLGRSPRVFFFALICCDLPPPLHLSQPAAFGGELFGGKKKKKIGQASLK